eukprot:gene3108-3940_t
MCLPPPVLSQLTSVYGEELIPGAFMTFINFFGMFLVLDMQSLVNSKCVAHYLQVALSGQGFLVTFYQNVAMPWCLSPPSIYLDFSTLHQLPPEVDWFNLCISVSNYLSQFQFAGSQSQLVHLTFRFGDFCLNLPKAIQYDDPQLEAVRFLKMDPQRFCLTEKWWYAATIAFLTLITFVIGFPLLVYITMRDRRKYVKARMSTADCRTHSDFIEDGLWKLKIDNEGFQFKSFWTAIFRGSAHNFVFTEVDGHARPEVDVYLHTSTFVELEDDNVSRSKMVKVLKKWRKSRDSSSNIVDQFFSSEAVKNKKAKNTVIELNTPKMERLRVTLHFKEDPGNHGNIKLVPVTLLDRVNSSKMLGQFFVPYEDKYGPITLEADCPPSHVAELCFLVVHPYMENGWFYFWQCWEVTRRVLQTGVVVIVQLVFDEVASLIYAALLSFVAITLHLSYSPFKNDSMNQLQLTILINQFMLQQIFIWVYMDSSFDEVAGVTLVVMQITPSLEPPSICGVGPWKMTEGVFVWKMTEGVFDWKMTEGVYAWKMTDGVFDWKMTEGVYVWKMTEGVYVWKMTEGVGVMGYTLTLVGPVFSPAFNFVKEKLMALIYICAYSFIPGYSSAKSRAHVATDTQAPMEDQKRDPHNLPQDCETKEFIIGGAKEVGDETVDTTAVGAHYGNAQVLNDKNHNELGSVTFTNSYFLG